MAVDLPDYFWKRVCNTNYKLTLEDLRSIDNIRYGMLQQMIDSEGLKEE